jgi:hypothetical protein
VIAGVLPTTTKALAVGRLVLQLKPLEICFQEKQIQQPLNERTLL